MGMSPTQNAILSHGSKESWTWNALGNEIIIFQLSWQLNVADQQAISISLVVFVAIIQIKRIQI